MSGAGPTAAGPANAEPRQHPRWKPRRDTRRGRCPSRAREAANADVKALAEIPFRRFSSGPDTAAISLRPRGDTLHRTGMVAPLPAGRPSTRTSNPLAIAATRDSPAALRKVPRRRPHRKPDGLRPASAIPRNGGIRAVDLGSSVRPHLSRSIEPRDWTSPRAEPADLLETCPSNQLMRVFALNSRCGDDAVLTLELHNPGTEIPRLRQLFEHRAEQLFGSRDRKLPVALVQLLVGSQSKSPRKSEPTAAANLLRQHSLASPKHTANGGGWVFFPDRGSACLEPDASVNPRLIP